FLFPFSFLLFLFPPLLLFSPFPPLPLFLFLLSFLSLSSPPLSFPFFPFPSSPLSSFPPLPLFLSPSFLFSSFFSLLLLSLSFPPLFLLSPLSFSLPSLFSPFLSSSPPLNFSSPFPNLFPRAFSFIQLLPLSLLLSSPLSLFPILHPFFSSLLMGFFSHFIFTLPFTTS
ncbi:hypothetical protein, partial [Staphylococcus aureus]|uniref:hypothetical protein n=1 Tax=Staphylococcus aureus TaxID=1280 RepID=UPI001680AE02